MSVAEFIFGIITNLLSSVVYDIYKELDFFKKRKIEQRINDATAAIVEPILPFLTNEGISEDRQRRLIQACIDELKPLTQNPELLFQGSLNGQKVFDDLYTDRDLPQVVIEDGLKDVYTLLCPRIATLLCKIPAAVKDWESEAWSENYRRLDELSDQLRTLFNKVDEIVNTSTSKADEILTTVRRTLAQKIRFELDLTGLRSDKPVIGTFDNFFVHPELTEKIDENKDVNETKVLSQAEETFEFYLNTSSRSILVGQPGSGKSTWAKWFQREALSTRWNGICVRVDLRGLPNDDLPSLHQIIREAAGQHLAEELTSHLIAEWIKLRKLVFILDGFDEIRPSDRDKIFEWIIELNLALKQCSILITSRPLTTNHLEKFYQNFQGWDVEAFDENRIVDYIQRWYRYTPLLSDDTRQIDASDLASQWLSDPTIGPLTGNPLLLSTLLMVHHLDGSLPSGRSELYTRYVQGMLGLWDGRRNVVATINLSLEEKRQIMRHFALEMFLQEQDQLDETAALELMKKILSKMNKSLSPEEVLEGLRERSGLIIGPGIYSFIHKSVAEYLVAEAVVQGNQRDKAGRRIDRLCLFEQRDNDRWNTVIFLWSGLAPISDVESFIEQCALANCFDLAYGILYDQYNKFSPEVRRIMLLMKITPQQLTDITNQSNFYFAFPCPNGYVDKLRIPSFGLRSLSYSPSLYRLFIRAAKDKTLVWTEHSGMTSGSLRDLFWMTFFIGSQDLNEWERCLQSEPPEDTSTKVWIFWVTIGVIGRIIEIENSSEVIRILEIFKVTYPQYEFFILIALINAGIEVIRDSIINNKENIISDKESDSIKFRIEKIFNMISNLFNPENFSIDYEWLEATSDWLSAPPEFKSFDLLEHFIASINTLTEQGLLNQNENHKHTLNLIQKLLDFRKKISN